MTLRGIEGRGIEGEPHPFIAQAPPDRSNSSETAAVPFPATSWLWLGIAIISITVVLVGIRKQFGAPPRWQKL